jgi:hypothetical protein
MSRSSEFVGQFVGYYKCDVTVTNSVCFTTIIASENGNMSTNLTCTHFLYKN